MGVVAKQSVQNMIITYVGFGFGALNTLFLFTHILSETDYGIVAYILATANLLWPLLAFGLQNTLVKFYTTYTNKKDAYSFFSWLLLVPLVIFLIVFSLYLVFYDNVMEYYDNSNPVMKSYVWVIIIMGLMAAYFEIFYSWTKVQLQSVKGNLLKELFHRVIISILLVIVYFNYLTPYQFVVSLAIIFTARTILMQQIAYKIHKPKFSLGRVHNLKSIATYSFLILIAATVSIFLLDLDKFMIENLAPPIANVAIYSICVYMVSVIAVPKRAMLQIENPLTAQLLVKKDISALSELNKKSSLTSLIVTLFVGLLVICNVHSIFEMIPKPYELYIEIILLVGFVKVTDAALGVTNSILFNSDSYQWILILGIGILGLAYYFNTIFIPSEGIVGAAFATFLSYTLYNLSKLIFVLYKFKIHPFTLKNVFALLIAFGIYAVFYHWHINIHPFLSIVIKGILISISYIAIIYFCKLSQEVNSIIHKTFKVE